MSLSRGIALLHRVLVRRCLRHCRSALAAAVLAGCTRETPKADVGRADLAAPPPPPAPLSRFSVPLEYDFTPIMQVVENAVPRSFGSMDNVRTAGDDNRKHYAFEAQRGRFTAFADGREVHLRATIAYRARGFYKPPLGPTLSAGCGSDSEKPRIVVELAAPITLTERWHLAGKTRLVSIEPASSEGRDRCDVSILHLDVTDRVVAAARSALAGRLPAIDGKIARIDLEPRFAGWWKLLEKPIRLTDGVWLLLNPEGLRIGRVGGRDRVLTVPVSLDARPRIVTGPTEPDVAGLPLPPLGHDSIRGGFHVLLDGVVDYATLSRAMSGALAGRQVTEGGRTVKVVRVAVLPASQGRLMLAIDFTGDAAGTLRLVGTPRYDPALRQLSVPNLDYDLATDDPLVNGYAWLRTDALRETLREKAHVPVDSALDRGRTLLLSGLNRKIGDVMTLSARVDSVAVRGLYVTRDGVVVRGEATGQAGVAVRQR